MDAKQDTAGTAVIPWSHQLLKWVEEATNAVKEAERQGHFIIGTFSVHALPPMHRPVVQSITINPDPEKKEVYELKRQLALSGKAWQKISNVLAIKWDIEASKRLDDGSDPDYCHYRAVGWIIGNQGTWENKPGEKEIRVDVLIEESREKFEAKVARWINGRFYKDEEVPNDFPEGRPNEIHDWINEKLRVERIQLRKHILARCQSGAMNRATKNMGIREAYTREELQNGTFTFLSLAFAPDPADPQVKDHYLRQAAGPMRDLYPSERATSSASKEGPQKPHTMDTPFFVVENGGEEEPTASKEPNATQPDTSENDKAAHARADFQACNKEETIHILADLAKRKNFTGTFKKPIEQWSESEHLAFYDKMIGLPDAEVAQPTTPGDLPF